MSDPQRHDWYEDDMRPAPYGLWVEYDAYKRLKAENDLLHRVLAIDPLLVEAINSMRLSQQTNNER